MIRLGYACISMATKNNPNKKTTSQKVLAATIKDFDYHAKVFDAMGLDENSVLVTHVGGVYGDKPSSLERFQENFAILPDHVKSRLVVENDDISFTMLEVLELCEEIGLPMVLDIHHHHCMNNGEEIMDYLPRIIKTWGTRTPKMHFSSPKSEDEFRSHSDDIHYEDFLSFVEKLTNYDLDIMLECKNKDEALLKLRKELTDNKVSMEPLYLRS